jgi:hypothetical protein
MFNSVDIYCPPSPKSSSSKECELTIGDLHSNAVLFLYFLQQHQIVSLTDEQYRVLVHHYGALEQAKEKQIPAQQVIFRTQQIIQMIESLSVIHKPRLRLIGDEMADRGVNDLFILLILKKLYDNKVPYKILLSNHGLCFISLYLGWIQNTKQINWMMNSEMMKSFNELKYSVELGLFKQEQIKDWIETFYLPCIHLVDYSLCKTSQRLTLYSHAAIGYKDVMDLAVYSEIPFQAETFLELAQTIEDIQSQFKTNIFPKICKLLCNMSNIDDEQDARNYFSIFMKSILWKICWNRDYSELVLFRPSRINSYFLRYVHGHDHKFTNDANYISLDGYLGKSLEDNCGELKELKSLDVSLKDYKQQEIQNSSWTEFFQCLLFNSDCKKYYPWIGLLVAGILIKKHQQQNPQSYLNGLFSYAKKILGFKSEPLQYIVYNKP